MKQRKCTICSCTKKITKHHIVPKCIGKYFSPKNFYDKGQSTGRIILLCEKCHNQYEIEAGKVKFFILLIFRSYKRYVKEGSEREIEDFWKEHFRIYGETL